MTGTYKFAGIFIELSNSTFHGVLEVTVLFSVSFVDE